MPCAIPRLGRGLLVALALAWPVLAPGPARADAAAGLGYFGQGRFGEALEAWQQAAAAGDGRAALYAGVLYDTGTGVAQDYGQARAWYRRGAEAGNATAMFNLGVMHDAGRGGAPDPAGAAAWYARGAAKGFARAEYNLALMYETGSGVARDRNRAVALYRAAAAHGLSAARMHLAQLGQPYAAARPNAAPEAQDAAMRDFGRAQQALLARGTAEAGQAVALFRRAAQEGNPVAAYDLGYCYEHGIGVPADRMEAMRWYGRAAGQAADATIEAIAEAARHNLEGQVNQAARQSGRPSS